MFISIYLYRLQRVGELIIVSIAKIILPIFSEMSSQNLYYVKSSQFPAPPHPVNLYGSDFDSLKCEYGTSMPQ